jgi:uncharacterized membrane protein YgcG
MMTTPDTDEERMLIYSRAKGTQSISAECRACSEENDFKWGGGEWGGGGGGGVRDIIKKNAYH